MLEEEHLKNKNIRYMEGGGYVDLKNYKITVGELLSNPKSKAVLHREFPNLINHPMIGMARNMTLEKVLRYAQDYLPKERIRQVISELERI